MPGLSRPTFAALERALMLDQDRQSQLMGRDLLDALLLQMDARLFGGTTFPGSIEVPRNCVLGGLGLVDASPNIVVGPGSLLQFSTTLVPTPGALDSPYRLGHLRTPQPLAIPGATAFYLVEAQVSEQVTASESRDVMNAITGDFVPTLLPKVTEALLNFQIIAGSATAFPAPSGGDWVCIGGFYAVGGSVFTIAGQFSGLFDMRPLPPVGIERKVFKNGYLTQRSYVSEQWDGVTPVDRFTSFDVEGFNAGAHVWFRNPAATLVSLAMLKTFAGASLDDAINPASAVADGSWFYVYICPWNGCHPTGQPLVFWDPGGATHKVYNGGFSRGVLVASSVPPLVQGDTTNGAVLNLPRPFSGTVAVGDATLVGAFCRAGASGVLSCQADGNKVTLANEQATAHARGFYTSTNIPLAAIQSVPLPSTLLPTSARRAHISANVTTALANTGGAAVFDLFGQSDASRIASAGFNSLAGGVILSADFALTKQGGGLPAVRFAASIAPPGDTLGLDLLAMGFSEGVL